MASSGTPLSLMMDTNEWPSLFRRHPQMPLRRSRSRRRRTVNQRANWASSLKSALTIRSVRCQVPSARAERSSGAAGCSGSPAGSGIGRVWNAEDGEVNLGPYGAGG